MKKVLLSVTAVLWIALALTLIACDSDSPASAENSTEGSSSSMANVVHVTDTIYRIMNIRDSIEEWAASDCDLHEDGSFECSKCTDLPIVNVSPLYVCHDSLGHVITCPKEIRDTFFVDLNYGDNPVTDYIPYVDVPEFNRDSVKELFAELSGGYCESLKELSSNYRLEAIGLPDSLEFYDASGLSYSLLTNNSTDSSDTDQYATIIHQPQCIVAYVETNICLINRVCRSPLPESLKSWTYMLANPSTKSFPDTTFQWKLVYTDQYGRGDTLDITSHFTN